jgi:hypothetical protein
MGDLGTSQNTHCLSEWPRDKEKPFMYLKEKDSCVNMSTEAHPIPIRMNLYAQVQAIALYRRIFNKEGPIDRTLFKMCEKSTFRASKGTVSFQLNHDDGFKKITRTDELGSAPGPDVEISLDMSVIGLDHSTMPINEEDSVQSAWYNTPLGKMDTEPGPLRRTDSMTVDEFKKREENDQ